MLLSTGMTSIKDIKESVELLEKSKVDYALFECTKLYPSPPEFVSLKGISELKNTFPNAIIGFSDHSIGPYMALSSIALGACIIERHFTDSFYREGPDITSSMDPSELKIIIEKSKEIFKHQKIINKGQSQKRVFLNLQEVVLLKPTKTYPLEK